MIKIFSGICFTVILHVGLLTCSPSSQKEKTMQQEAIQKTTGSIERLDPALDQILDTTTKIEILAEGFDWSEGPVWVADGSYLLFSDIPPNKIFKWDEKEGLKEYLHPSGYTGTVPRGGEPGSNGLILDAEGRLVLCQHGDRKMARMDAPLDNPKPNFITLVDNYQGKKLNSPNDAVYHSNGDLYFTDPPYGLIKNMDDSSKELDFQGVFRLSKNGKLDLLTKELSRPNGIAFSPDEKKLYVANSDGERKIWMVFDLAADGSVQNERVFYDATAINEPGSPDGLKIDKQGNIFATGPGGVWIFDSNAKVLGKIKTGQANSNCAFNSDQTELYITADMYLVRVKLKKR